MPRNKGAQATIDTSCLCALEHLHLFRQLTFLFEEIHIPKRVREEYVKKFQSRKVLVKVHRELAPYKYCNVADEISVRLLLDELRTRKRARENEGEAEAIVQASQIGATVVIVDEKRARRWATGRGLQCCGTLWILEQLRRRDLIGALRPLIDVLERNAIRLPRDEVRRLLVEFGEEEP